MVARTITPATTLNLSTIASGDVCTVTPGTYRHQWNPVSGVTYLMQAGSIIKGSDVVTGWTTQTLGRFSKAWTINSHQVFIDGILQDQIGGNLNDSFSNSSFLPEAPAENVGVWPGRVSGSAATMPVGSFYYDQTTNTMWIRPTGGTISGKTIEISVRAYLLYTDNKNNVDIVGPAKFTHANQTNTGRAGTVRIMGNFWHLEGIEITQTDGTGMTMRGNDNQVLFCKFTFNGQLGAVITGRRGKFNDNRFDDNNTRHFHGNWEAGGIKCIGSSPIDGVQGMLESEFLRNTAFRNLFSNGFWWDANHQVGVSRNKIRFNRAAYNGLEGLFEEFSEHTATISDNWIWKNGLRGIHGPSKTVDYEHNLVALNGVRGIAILDQFRGVVPSGNNVRYNINAWNSGDQDYTLPASTVSNTSNFNLFVQEGSSLAILGQQNQGTRLGLVAWRAWTGKDLNSWESVLAVPASITNAVNAGAETIDWTPLTNIASAVNPSNPPGPTAQAGSAPAAPTNLQATSGENAQSTCTWNAVTGATSYTLTHGATNGGPYTVPIPGITGTSRVVTGLPNGAPRYFIVQALNANGTSVASLQATGTPAAPVSAPLAPTSLVATSGENGSSTLTWTASAGATTYTIKHGATNGGPYTVIVAGITGSPRQITGLPNDQLRYFIATASNTGGESVPSNQATGTPVAPAAPVPIAPTITGIDPGDTSLSVVWGAVATALTYTVKWGTTPGGPYPFSEAGITATSFTIPDLLNGQNYRVVASASNASGESPNSLEFSATPEDPTPQQPAPPELDPPIVGDTFVILTWPWVSGALTYTVKWGLANGGPYPNELTNISTSTKVVDLLTNDVLHFFVAQANNTIGSSLLSNQVSATPQVAPPEPPPAAPPEPLLKLSTGTQQPVTV